MLVVLFCVKGLTHIESVVGAMVEVFHAFTAAGGRDILPLLCKLYVRMLLFEVVFENSFYFICCFVDCCQHPRLIGMFLNVLCCA